MYETANRRRAAFRSRDYFSNIQILTQVSMQIRSAIAARMHVGMKFVRSFPFLFGLGVYSTVKASKVLHKHCITAYPEKLNKAISGERANREGLLAPARALCRQRRFDRLQGLRVPLEHLYLRAPRPGVFNGQCSNLGTV